MSNGAAPSLPPLAQKLLVIDAVSDAYKFVFGNLKPLARAAAIPFAILAAAALRGVWAEQVSNMSVFSEYLWGALTYAAVVPFQTQLCRHALKLTGNHAPVLGFPWGRRESWFAIHQLGLTAAFCGFVLGADYVISESILTSSTGSGARPDFGGIVTAVVLYLCLILFAIVVALRIALALPAAGIGHSADWRRIWSLTRGNTFRIFLAQLIGLLPWFLIQSWIILPVALVNLFQGPTRGAAAHPAPPLLSFAGDFLFNALSLLNLALMLAITTFSYKHLVLGAQDTSASAPSTPSTPS